MVPDDNEHPSGVADGTVVATVVHTEVGQPVDVVEEVVVHEPDGAWHKEAGS